MLPNRNLKCELVICHKCNGYRTIKDKKTGKLNDCSVCNGDGVLRKITIVEYENWFDKKEIR